MSEQRKNPVWPWIAVMLLMLPVLYLVSLGPWVWLLTHHVLPKSLELWLVRATNSYAAPSNFVHDHAPQPVQKIMEGYIQLWLAHE